MREKTYRIKTNNQELLIRKQNRKVVLRYGFQKVVFEIKERIRKRYERERIKIEKLLTLGYTTSLWQK